MSQLPALFCRGERLRPLGAPIRPEPAAPAAPFNNWSSATKGDGAPKLVRLCLTDEAQAEEDDFHAIGYDEQGCVCFTGCAPCGWCTHPGNPLNLAEDDDAWVMGLEGGAA